VIGVPRNRIVGIGPLTRVVRTSTEAVTVNRLNMSECTLPVMKRSFSGGKCVALIGALRRAALLARIGKDDKSHAAEYENTDAEADQ